MIIVLVVGIVILIMSYTIESITNFLGSRKGRYVYQRLEWNMNQTLQLQRIIHEQVNMGTWDNTSRAGVPTTKVGDRLARIDTASDLKHPVLLREVTEKAARADQAHANQAQESKDSVQTPVNSVDTYKV
jgi:hypothetical protein